MTQAEAKGYEGKMVTVNMYVSNYVCTQTTAYHFSILALGSVVILREKFVFMALLVIPKIRLKPQMRDLSPC